MSSFCLFLSTGLFDPGHKPSKIDDFRLFQQQLQVGLLVIDFALQDDSRNPIFLYEPVEVADGAAGEVCRLLNRQQLVDGRLRNSGFKFDKFVETVLKGDVLPLESFELFQISALLQVFHAGKHKHTIRIVQVNLRLSPEITRYRIFTSDNFADLFPIRNGSVKYYIDRLLERHSDINIVKFLNLVAIIVVIFIAFCFKM